MRFLIMPLFLASSLYISSSYAQDDDKAKTNTQNDHSDWLSGLDEIMDAPLTSGPLLTAEAKALYNSTWECSTNPPGDEVGVKTQMTVKRLSVDQVEIEELNYIAYQPKAIEITMHYDATVGRDSNNNIKVTTSKSRMGKVKYWPKGMEMNPPEQVKMEFSVLTPSRISGRTTSYGITSSLSCHTE